MSARGDPKAARPLIAHEDPVVFVSDIHLRYGDTAYLETFVAFLDSIPGAASALYIHGDLFDFYVGPRQGRLPFYRPLFDALRRLVDGGIGVVVLHGNRDFLIGKQFADCGASVIPDEVELELGKLRAHLSHGDQFCINDRSYLFWARGVLRTTPVRSFVRALPSGVGIWLARRYRSISRRKMARNGQWSRLPSILDGVRAFLAQERFDAVICGHIHHLASTALEVSGHTSVLYTTGAWEEGPNYLLYAHGRIEARQFVPPASRCRSGAAQE